MQNVAVWPGRNPSKKLPGLYPWLQFQEYFTRYDWIESFGIDVERINETAALAYLELEKAFFETYGDDCVAAIGLAHTIAIKQTRLEKVRGQFIDAAAPCSPIEQILLAHLMWADFGLPEKNLVEIWDSSRTAQPRADVVIAPQHQIGQLRVDFGVFVNVVRNEEVKIAVECDGRKFHAQEEHQVARDKGRDRCVQLVGWRPLRFTGSEIWRNAAKCAAEVAALAKREVEAQLRRRGFEIP
jgi:very-short-patch-repair endonuclease